MTAAAASRREARDRPYSAAHAESVRRVSAFHAAEVPPFAALRSWFTSAWTDETPHSIHGAGVEWSGPGRIVREDASAVTDPGGGSALGSPRFAPAFRRRILEDRWGDTEHPVSDGRPEVSEDYATPLHQAVRYLDRAHPLIAEWLRALGRHGGDWRAVGQLGLIIDDRGVHIPLPDEYAEEITRGALRLAWLSMRTSTGR